MSGWECCGHKIADSACAFNVESGLIVIASSWSSEALERDAFTKSRCNSHNRNIDGGRRTAVFDNDYILREGGLGYVKLIDINSHGSVHDLCT